MHLFAPFLFAMRAFAPTALLSLALAVAALAHAAAGVEVLVVKAGPQAVTVGIELDGVVEPVKQSTVAAQASGRISQLAVKAGDHVRAGQLLATIDDRESQTGVQRSRAQTAQAEAELRNAQAQVQRTRELHFEGLRQQSGAGYSRIGVQGSRGRSRSGRRRASANR